MRAIASIGGAILRSTVDQSSGGCPVKRPQATAANGCPVMKDGVAAATSSAGAAGAAASACPVLQRHQAEGCDSDTLAINPLNRMPATPAQQRADGQDVPLDTNRVASTIPKADGDTWVYPSPQMFYNALVRKGKGGGVREDEMESVVAIHNNMNETTWRQVLEWEDLHCAECDAPRKLIRFLGRPDELSPKAAAKFYLGLAPRPFDRHDWTVDRCGKEVRYIIDYYDVAEKRSEDRVPGLHEQGAVPSIFCDVRPAGDSLAELLDRARMLFSSMSAKGAVPPTSAENLGKNAAASESTSGSAATQQAKDSGVNTPPREHSDAQRAHMVCADRIAALQACDGETQCAQAHIGLIHCLAKQVCVQEADAFSRCAGEVKDAKSQAAAEERYGQMEACVSKWAQAAEQKA